MNHINRWKTRARVLAALGLIGALLIGVLVVSAQTTTYTVVFGDTFEGIARRFDISVEALLDVNNLARSSVVFPGVVLEIPQNAPPFGYVAPTGDDLNAAQSRSAARAGRLYVLQFGDVLDLIAVYYDAQIRCLIDANAIPNPQRIPAGAILLIPNDCAPYDGMSSIGVARGYEVGSERALRPATRAAVQTDIVVSIPTTSQG
ncbi:MAG: LysM domain-containing protein [Chloroflexota bacterium]|nr:LysM domain-containing protein [Chloroflexota bacterium]